MIIGTKPTDFSRAISSSITSSLHWSMLIPDTDVLAIPRSIKPIHTLTEHLRLVPKAPWKRFCEWFPGYPQYSNSIHIVFSYLPEALPTWISCTHQLLWCIFCVFKKLRYWNYLCSKYEKRIARHFSLLVEWGVWALSCCQ